MESFSLYLNESSVLNKDTDITISYYDNLDSLFKYTLPSANSQIRQGVSYFFDWAESKEELNNVISWFETVFLNWVIKTNFNRFNALKMPLEWYVNNIFADLAFSGTPYPEPNRFRYSSKIGDDRFTKDVLSRLPQYALSSDVLFPSGFETAMEIAADDLIFDIGGTLDYFHSIRNQPIFQRINHMSVPEVMQKVKNAEKKDGEYKEIEGTDIKKMFPLSDGYFVVQILTPVALDRESYHCKHCVGKGNYDKKVLTGTSQIYSIRNKGNKPVVTIEVSNNKIIQAREHNNQPIQEYQKYYLEFLQNMNLSY